MTASPQQSAKVWRSIKYWSDSSKLTLTEIFILPTWRFISELISDVVGQSTWLFTPKLIIHSTTFMSLRGPVSNLKKVTLITGLMRIWWMNIIVKVTYMPCFCEGYIECDIALFAKPWTSTLGMYSNGITTNCASNTTITLTPCSAIQQKWPWAKQPPYYCGINNSVMLQA